VVVEEIAPLGCCIGGCGHPGDIDHHADHLGGHCVGRHGDHPFVTPVVAVVETIVIASFIVDR
jgi:hypothetical protein